MPTHFHALYFAHELTRSRQANDIARLSRSLLDAAIDLNPHQIEAALFALRSPLDTGALLADEVGLGKTVEAGLLLLQSWAEHKRRLLVICPASLRRQWAAELWEKFGLPCVIMDRRSLAGDSDAGFLDTEQHVCVASYGFASGLEDRLRRTSFDLVVMDEAHKLRNSWKPTNIMGNRLREALRGRRKVLLTATPLQNSTMELYGLASLIDEYIFGDTATFRRNFTGTGTNLEVLRARIRSFCHRTLRTDVQEYVQYTERRPITVPFQPSDAEQALYAAVSGFLQREQVLSLPPRQSQLLLLVMRKLLASSTPAILGTLDTIIQRLEGRHAADGAAPDRTDMTELLGSILEGEDLPDEEAEDEWEGSREEEVMDPQAPSLGEELAELRRIRTMAAAIPEDSKATALLKALEIGFDEMARTGAARKALIFTESRRTQDHLLRFLEANGYAGSIVLFNGSNSDPASQAVLNAWLADNPDRATGSRAVDMRTALVERFGTGASIMLATEAAAEGINLQFCSLVINYDLPWNPQRIEQRIGRCHRYGQRHDVVVINFLNQRNAADLRVYELLDQKFHLFRGVFGASDEVLGTLESGVDFERRILSIYQQCRTEAEIDRAFAALQAEMEEVIRTRMAEARRLLFTHFDEDVHARLRLKAEDARMVLDRTSRMFWVLTRYMLGERAEFDDANLSFQLHRPPVPDVATGRYQLVARQREGAVVGHAYRLTHPLAEHLITAAKQLDTPLSEIRFDLSAHPTRISVLEQYLNKTGWLTLSLVTVDGFEREEILVMTAIDRNQRPLPREAAEKMFMVPARWEGPRKPPHPLIQEVLDEKVAQDVALAVDTARARNSRHLHERRIRLEQWAEDRLRAAEKTLDDLKARVKELSRQAQQIDDLSEQHRIQTEIQAVEREKRKARQHIFEVEDEVTAERTRLIDDLARRLHERHEVRTLFTLRWRLV